MLVHPTTNTAGTSIKHMLPQQTGHSSPAFLGSHNAEEPLHGEISLLQISLTT